MAEIAKQTKSLKANGSDLANAKHQIALLNKGKTPDFNDYLKIKWKILAENF